MVVQASEEEEPVSEVALVDQVGEAGKDLEVEEDPAVGVEGLGVGHSLELEVEDQGGVDPMEAGQMAVQETELEEEDGHHDWEDLSMEEAEPGPVVEDLEGLVGQEDLEVDVEEFVQLKGGKIISTIKILLVNFSASVLMYKRPSLTDVYFFL